jgi:hypothetical protein
MAAAAACKTEQNSLPHCASPSGADQAQYRRFDHAAVTISGIELAEQIKKGQFKTGKFGKRKATMSELWNAALAA